MSIQAFIERLHRLLSALSEEDIRASIEYYREALEDRVEDGMTEEEAVRDIGSPEAAAEKIIQEIPVAKLVKAKLPKQIPIAFIVLGSPVWASVLLALFAVIVSIYAAFWAILWSVTCAYLAILAAFLFAIPSAAICAILSFLYETHLIGVGYLGVCLFFSGIVMPLLRTVKPVLRFAVRATVKSLCLFKRVLILRKAS